MNKVNFVGRKIVKTIKISVTVIFASGVTLGGIVGLIAGIALSKSPSFKVDAKVNDMEVHYE